MDERLYFQCPCGYWSRHLGEFVDHAFVCRAERVRAWSRVRVQHKCRTPARWRVGYYQARMLGWPVPTRSVAQDAPGSG